MAQKTPYNMFDLIPGPPNEVIRPIQEFQRQVELAIAGVSPIGGSGGTVTASGGIASTGGLTLNTLPADGDIIALAGIPFTFRTVVSDPVSEIQIGANTTITAANSATVLNASVIPAVAEATYSSAANHLAIVFDTAGTIGNSFTVSKTSSHITVDGATLSGGLGPLFINQLVKGTGGSNITSGDLSGDVTTSGSMTTLIANGAVTLAKMVNMSTASLLGRNSAGTGSPEVLSASTVKSILALNNVTNDAQVKRTEMGVALGVATLDASTKIPLSQLPDTVIGAVEYQGTWNASTNSPNLPILSPSKGDYYVVSVTGSTSLGGITDWKVGDWAIYNGAAWEKVDNTDAVWSVFGRFGAVVAATNDYSWAQIDKSVSSFADITTRSAVDIASGTLSDARLSNNVPLKNAANIFTNTNQFEYVGMGGTAPESGHTTTAAFLKISKSGVNLDTDNNNAVYIKTSGGGGALGEHLTALYLEAHSTSNSLAGAGGPLGLNTQLYVDSGVSTSIAQTANLFLNVQGSTGTAYGVANQIVVSGSVSTVKGDSVDLLTTGTSQNVVGYSVLIRAQSGGTVASSVKGFEVIGFGGTAPLNSYGIYLGSSIDVGTSSSWAIYSLSSSPSFLSGDLRVSGLLKTGSTPVTLTDGPGKILSVALNTVQPAQGGTGQSFYAVGDLLYASGSTALNKLADVAAGSYLRSGGTNTAPLWSTLVLPNTITAGSIVFASASNTYGQDNANLFWDDANNRLGILTATPSQPLEVGGNIFINTATANLFLKDTSTGFLSSSSTVITPQNNNSLRSTSFTGGLVGWDINAAGNAEFENVLIRGELRASVFKVNEISATAGTFGVFYSASTVFTDFTTPASTSTSFTFNAKNSDITASAMLFAVNDTVRFKAYIGSSTVIGDAWATITARTNNTTHTTYTATLNSGSLSTTFRAGTAVVDYGPSGTGFITMSTDGTVGSTPNMTMATHAGSPWSAFTTLIRLGNLNGAYGYITDVYGFASGQYGSANKPWITLDTTNGLRIGGGSSGTSTLAQWDTSGGITVGQVGAGLANVVITSAGMDLRVNTTIRAHLDATGSAYFGNGNLSISTSGILTIGSWTVNSTNITGSSTILDSTGKLTLGTGNDVAILDAVDSVYRLVIGHLTYTSAPFRVSKTGVLSATGAIISGNITATTGVIGGFDIGTDYIRDSANSFGLASAVSGGDDVRFWAGAAFSSRTTAPFRITEAGVITATSGLIGGWSLTSTDIRNSGATVMLRGAGNLAFGSTPPTSTTVGTGLFIDSTGLYSLNSSTQRIKLDQNGLIAGGVTISGALTGSTIIISTGTGHSFGDGLEIKTAGTATLVNAEHYSPTIIMTGKGFGAGGVENLATINQIVKVESNGFGLQDYYWELAGQWGVLMRAHATISGNGGTVNIPGSLTIGSLTGVLSASGGVVSTIGIIGSVYGGTGNGFTKFTGPITSEKTFTLPNASAAILTDNTTITIAQGGTGDNGTAWIAYTPTVTTATGTITTLGTVTGRYKTIGKTVVFEVVVPITINGTGAGSVRATLPFQAAAFEFMVSGAETATTGKGLVGYIDVSSTFVLMLFYDGTYPGANGRRMVCSGTYERV